jgi:(p)ppGpp synthase/HD superfamily hydrolase
MTSINGGSMTQFKLKLFQYAIYYAFEAHNGQKRKDGKTPYIIHPLTVMTRVARKTDDINAWIASLLHDVVEDSEEPDSVLKDLEFKFGTDVANMVNILTRRKSANETYDDYIDRIAKSNNEQAIIIKIEDIQHNLSTIHEIDYQARKSENLSNRAIMEMGVDEFSREKKYKQALSYLFSRLIKLDSKNQ